METNHYNSLLLEILDSLPQGPLQILLRTRVRLFQNFYQLLANSSIGRAISLAGDELTLAQGKQVFKDSLGYDMPETYGFIGNGIKYMIKEVGTMFTWFKDEGYGADIQVLRKEG